MKPVYAPAHRHRAPSHAERRGDSVGDRRDARLLGRLLIVAAAGALAAAAGLLAVAAVPVAVVGRARPTAAPVASGL